MVAAGYWMPPRPALNIIRERLAEDHWPFAKLLGTAAFAKRFGGLTDDEAGVRLTRVPRGFAPDHPAADWLRFASFTASRNLTDAEALSPKLVDNIMKDYALLLPMVRWLNATLGHAAATRR